MKIAFVTGSRADWNGLGMVAKAFKADGRFDVAVVVTGQHVETGTLDLIEADGLKINRICNLRRAGDSPASISQAVGMAVSNIGMALDALNPDLVILLGDRYETLAGALAAVTLRIPIAHLSGGDVTEGSLDDKYRNAITMMADLHFPTHDAAANRVMYMSGIGSNVYMVGAPVLDRIREVPVAIDRVTFCRAYGIDPDKQNILVAFHPVTTDADMAAQCREMVDALRTVDAGLLVLGTNADAGSAAVTDMLRDLGGSRYVENLPAPMFYAALTHMNLMIGNSSAGIYETAGFGIPVVNVGNRQAGRMAPANVLGVPAKVDLIMRAINLQLKAGRMVCGNPYGDGHSSNRIVEIVAKHFGVENV